MADQSSEGLLSPWLRKKRFEAAKPYLDGLVLDFGCGSGSLAEYVSQDKYLGIEMDAVSLEKARLNFPDHCFSSELPQTTNEYDTIVTLAVIEHVKNPTKLLSMLSQYLKASDKARLILTTPHPAMDWIHTIGANIGLFSKHANEEHESLLNKKSLETAGLEAGLTLIDYRRFLYGANQLAVFTKKLT
jgi:2-polyprenyl-3-methyl-5-hydroxy-6-metoxy-1,4-benzoquinol methylase